MAKYMKREIADLNNTGKTQAYYKLVNWGRINYEELLDRCVRHGGGFSRGVLMGAISTVLHEMSLLMADGNTVKIDGLGTFGAKLGVRPDKEQDAFEEGESARNVLSLMVDGISFKADKELVLATNSHCRFLERGGVSRLKKSPYTEQERLERARQYLAEHGVMRVAAYAELTGLSHSTASRELCRLAQMPESGITSSGCRSTKVYLLRKTE